jgi:uncharacterized membrane protein
MFSLPLHPAIVHIPLGLAFAIPLLALIVWFALRKNFMSPHCWWMVVFFQIVLLGSGFVAMETGEDEEHTVERIVAEEIIEQHEERAEIFVWISGAIAALLGLGAIAPQAFSPWLKNMGLLAVVINFFLALWVGHSGGELVYKHNAGSAYSDSLVPGQK